MQKKRSTLGLKRRTTTKLEGVKTEKEGNGDQLEPTHTKREEGDNTEKGVADRQVVNGK